MKYRMYVFWFVFAVISYSMLELSAFGALVILKNIKNIEYATEDIGLSDGQSEKIISLIEKKQTYVTYHPVLGWTVAKNNSTDLYRSNSAGIRSDREYSAEKPEGVVRIGTFGDSFTHGDEVGGHETWQSIMEQKNERLEVLNFGVPGYGTDQALLRYRDEGGTFEFDYVIIGFFSDDINRHVNTFRPFQMKNTGLAMGKPRFTLAKEGLMLIPNYFQSLFVYQLLLDNSKEELRKIGKWDYFYNSKIRNTSWDFLPSVRLWKIGQNELGSDEPIYSNRKYNINSEAYMITEAIMDTFISEVQSANAKPIVLLMPSKDDLKILKKNGFLPYQPLKEWLAGSGYDFLDVADLLSSNDDLSDPGKFYSPNHFSPDSNRLIAEYILEYLELQ